MNNSIQKKEREIRIRILRKKHIRRVLAVCIATVVLLTMGALTKPALTASATTYCGKTEHVHDSSCVEKVLVCNIPTSDTQEEDESSAGRKASIDTKKIVAGGGVARAF